MCGFLKSHLLQSISIRLGILGPAVRLISQPKLVTFFVESGVVYMDLLNCNRKNSNVKVAFFSQEAGRATGTEVSSL